MTKQQTTNANGRPNPENGVPVPIHQSTERIVQPGQRDGCAEQEQWKRRYKKSGELQRNMNGFPARSHQHNDVDGNDEQRAPAGKRLFAAQRRQTCDAEQEQDDGGNEEIRSRKQPHRPGQCFQSCPIVFLYRSDIPGVVEEGRQHHENRCRA